MPNGRGTGRSFHMQKGGRKIKKFITTAIIASCLALCAAVWPQTAMVEEILQPTPTPAETATEPTVTEVKVGFETASLTEKETAETPQQEPNHETTHEPESVTVEVSAAPEVQSTPEPEQESTPAQVVTNPQPGDMVYVEGFGWLECHGPGEVTYAEDMYENGNKIGIMG